MSIAACCLSLSMVLLLVPVPKPLTQCHRCCPLLEDRPLEAGGLYPPADTLRMHARARRGFRHAFTVRDPHHDGEVVSAKLPPRIRAIGFLDPGVCPSGVAIPSFRAGGRRRAESVGQR